MHARRFVFHEREPAWVSSLSSPPVHGRHGSVPAAGRTSTLLAGIRADRTTSIAFPGHRPLTRPAIQWLRDGSGANRNGFGSLVCLPLRGQRRLGLFG